jgi:ADP-dependent glucokinase
MSRVLEILCVFSAILGALYLAYQQPQTLTAASVYERFKAILSADPNSAQVHYPLVGVGYNTGSDLVVRAISVLNQLELRPSQDSKSVESVSSLEDLSDLVSHFMSQGSAAERVIVNLDLCARIVNAARATEGTKKPHVTLVEKQHFCELPDWLTATFELLLGREIIGGNAALIALRMADRTKVLLAGSLDKTVKAQLHPNVSLLEGQQAPNPMEVHLILEYAKGEKWGHIIAPRANRVILHCDRTNAELKTMKSFHQLVNLKPQPRNRVGKASKNPSADNVNQGSSSTSNPVDLLVLSGFHLLDQEAPAIQHQKLRELLHVIDPTKELDASIPVHLELASVGNLAYIAELGKTVVPNVNSLGLNEQELGFLYFALIHAKSDYKSSAEHTLAASEYVHREFSDPSPNLVLEALSHLFSLPFARPQRRLDRIHFHSLKFHVIATRKSSQWQDSTYGAILGSIAATVNACAFNRHNPFDISRVDFLADSKTSSLFSQKPLHVSHKGDIAFSIVPVLVCKDPRATVGLGDAISASGLLHHRFVPS